VRALFWPFTKRPYGAFFAMQLTSLSLALTRAGGVGFSPASLFLAGEQGAWYDPSAMETLFQDASGVTPVTAVEQPVGLMLDKSKGLVLGPELVTNGDFSNGTTGWTAGDSTISVVSGGLRVTNTTTSSGNASQFFSTVIGRTYAVTFSALASSGANLDFRVGTSVASSVNLRVNSTTAGTNYTAYFSATATNTAISVVAFNSSGTIGSFVSLDNISVRELPGNHAFTPAAATTSRPVLSARVNLLTKTEEFNDGAWVKSAIGTASTVTANTEIAPNGTQTADTITNSASPSGEIVYQDILVSSGATVSASIRFKRGNHDWVRISVVNSLNSFGAWFDLLNGVTGTTQVEGTAVFVSKSISDEGNGWYACTVVGSIPSETTYRLINASASADNSFTRVTNGTRIVWGADLRVANDGVGLEPYQRVNTATDYDAGPQWPRYLRTDGSDDWMQTNTFTPGTDKVQVFAGVRKLSDGAAGIVAETGSAGIENGSFTVFAPRNANVPSIGFRSRGTVEALANNTTLFASPVTNVITGIGDISGDICILQVNATQVASSTADQGTGNFLAYPLYLFRRGGASLPFNGRFYGMIVRFGDTLPAASITAAENYMNIRTKAF